MVVLPVTARLPAAVTAPSKVTLLAVMLVAPPNVTRLANTNEAADKVAGLVKVTGPSKRMAAELLKSPSQVMGPVLNKRKR